MKKSILAILLCLALCFSVVLTACDGGKDPNPDTDPGTEDPDNKPDDKPVDTAYVITITDMEGNGVAGVSIQLCDVNNCRLIRTPSDANGVIRAEDLPDPVGGVYKLQFIVVPDGYENMYPNSGTEYIYFEEGSRTLDVLLPYKVGSRPDAPMVIEDDKDYTVAAGETVYYILKGQYPAVLRNLSADCAVKMGEDTVAVEGGVAEINPAVSEVGVTLTYFSVTNNGTADATFHSAIIIPLGAMENPEILDAAGDEVTVSGTAAYYLSYTATAAGALRISTETVGCEITVNNLTTYLYGAATADAVEVTVAAGDELQIILNSSAECVYTVTFTAE